MVLVGPALTPGANVAATIALAGGGGPDSPLVVYGDTSQDGIWYSGFNDKLTQRVFGPKPFPHMVGNGTPIYIFPVANQYRFAGNDVIDASADFAAPGVPNGSLPTVGLTIYGGPGDDFIRGSQTGDFLAGGSGNDVIWGERGADQIYGDSGVNVQVITRQLDIPTVNTSVYPNHDSLVAG